MTRSLAVHIALLREIGVKILEFTCNLAGAARGIELRDASNAAFPGLEGTPCGVLAVSDGRNHAKSGDDDLLHFHVSFCLSRFGLNRYC